MRKIETVMGDGRVAGTGLALRGKFGKAGDARAIVKPLAPCNLADASTALALKDIFSRFAPPGYELHFAESGTWPTGREQTFAVSKNTWKFFAEIHRGEDHIGEICREVKLSDRLARHWHFDLGDHSGDGLGPAFLACAQTLYEELGIKKIELHAGGSVGAVLWARIGFRFTDSQAKEARIMYDAWESCAAGAFPKRNDAEWDAQEFLALGDGDRSWTVKSAWRVANGFADAPDALFESIWAQRAADNDIDNNKIDIDAPRTLGECVMFLLAEWEGVLDFADEAAMSSFRQFLAKGDKHLS